MHLYKPVGRLCDVSMHLRIAAYNCNGEYIYVCVEEDLRIWKRNSLVVRQYHSDDTLLIFLFSPLVPPLLLEKKITMAGWRRKEEGEDSEEKKKKENYAISFLSSMQSVYPFAMQLFLFIPLNRMRFHRALRPRISDRMVVRMIKLERGEDWKVNSGLKTLKWRKARWL